MLKQCLANRSEKLQESEQKINITKFKMCQGIPQKDEEGNLQRVSTG